MPSSDAAEARPSLHAFWLRLALFAFGLALGWFGLERGMSRLSQSYSFKHQGLHAQAATIDTLILGSSETYYGISPHLLAGTAYNLANWSQSLYFDHELMKQELPGLPKLERVIVLVNYMSLYTELYDHPESWRQFEYYREWGIPLQQPVDYLNLRLWSSVALYSPHAAIEALTHGFRDRPSRIDDRGWYRVPDEDRWGVDERQAARRLAVHHGFMHEKYFAGNVRELEALLTLMSKHHVEVVLLTTPVWRTYRAGIRQADWQRARAVFVSLAEKYGARYLDFQTEPRLTADDFEDPDHLNAVGAAHFTKLLDAVLGPPGTADAQAPVRGSTARLGG
jgi:hypothetical protein